MNLLTLRGQSAALRYDSLKSPLPAVIRPSAERWRQIEDLFHEASTCDPRSRSEFLERACGTDSDLRREVESLLANLNEPALFLEFAVQDAADAYLEDKLAPAIQDGCLLDRYRVLRLLGTGGMGEVYLAEDTRLKRKVALKMLSRNLTRDALALRRLEQEAQVVSGLNHTNPVTVFEFCHFEDRHFLVTEFVDGDTIRQLVSQGPLEPEKAIDTAT